MTERGCSPSRRGERPLKSGNGAVPRNWRSPHGDALRVDPGNWRRSRRLLAIRRPPFLGRFVRAATVTPGLVGLAAQQPATWTRRLPSSMKKSMYSRWSPTGSTVKKSTASTLCAGCSSRAPAPTYAARRVSWPRPLTKPSRQLGYSSCQPSSRFAFAFDAPRPSVIIVDSASPAMSRPSDNGT